MRGVHVVIVVDGGVLHGIVGEVQSFIRAYNSKPTISWSLVKVMV